MPRPAGAPLRVAVGLLGWLACVGFATATPPPEEEAACPAAGGCGEGGDDGAALLQLREERAAEGAEAAPYELVVRCTGGQKVVRYTDGKWDTDISIPDRADGDVSNIGCQSGSVIVQVGAAKFMGMASGLSYDMGCTLIPEEAESLVTPKGQGKLGAQNPPTIFVPGHTKINRQVCQNKAGYAAVFAATDMGAMTGGGSHFTHTEILYNSMFEVGSVVVQKALSFACPEPEPHGSNGNGYYCTPALEANSNTNSLMVSISCNNVNTMLQTSPNSGGKSATFSCSDNTPITAKYTSRFVERPR